MINRLERQIAKFRQLKTAAEIRFERKRNSVAIYGVAEKPLVANVNDWRRFLSENGAETLRKFIEDEFVTNQSKRSGSAAA
jgi:hypothetical protein